MCFYNYIHLYLGLHVVLDLMLFLSCYIKISDIFLPFRSSNWMMINIKILNTISHDEAFCAAIFTIYV